MKLERLLQMNMALLATLGTFLLGVGQQSLQLPSMAVFAAVTSVLFTDTLKWFRLNRFVANLFAVLAAVYSLHSFFQHESHEQLIAVANLLIYLQFILLFQEKSERVYWQLMVLSLLQVVVAAALNLQLSSAFLLVMYMLAAISGLMLFFVHREFSRFQCSAHPGSAKRESAPAGARPAGFRLNGAPVALFSISPGALSRLSLQGTFLRQIGSIGLTTLAFTFIFFYAIPRRGGPIWDGPPNAPRQESGFGRSIELDRSGRIRQSNKPVMRVSFLDGQTGEPTPAPYYPYFRGSVLANYSVSENRWSATYESRQGGMRELRRVSAPEGLVRQEFVLNMSSDATLLGMHPAYLAADSPKQIRYDRSQDRLVFYAKSGDPTPRIFRYALLTDALRANWQSPLIPAPPPRYVELRHSLSMPFDELRELSDRIVAENNVEAGDTLAIVEALQVYLSGTGGFTYSLDYTRTDRGLDPIVDFVLNHRSGHCEFFASALCLMLRSQNIPARIAVGFKGGDYNSVGDYFQIRQKHAHAWVEAYFTRDQIPAWMIAPHQQIQHGGWVRFDATPSSTQASAGESSGLIRRVDQFLDYFNFLWDDYVLGLDASQQQESIYDPLSEQAPDAVSPRGLRALFGNIRGWFREHGRTVGWWIAALCGVTAIGVIYEVIVRRSKRLSRWRLAPLLRRLASRIAPRLVRRVNEPDDGESERRRVEFYERLSRLLAAHGLIRGACQTQREFAEAARQQLSNRAAAGAVAPLPKSIVELFYRVRFGAAELDDRETQQVEQTLDRLEDALSVGDCEEINP